MGDHEDIPRAIQNVADGTEINTVDCGWIMNEENYISTAVMV